MKSTPMWARIIILTTLQLQWGDIIARFPSGELLRFKGRTPGKTAYIHLKDYRAIRRLLSGGNLGWGEAYLDDQWDSPDVAVFLEVVAINSEQVQIYFETNTWAKIGSFVLRLMHRNTKPQARKNIEAHYDLGNDFYETWLDPTMTYSCARFTNEANSLEAAQINKYKMLAERINLAPDHSLLEIGCGWGGFAEYVAKTFGCKVTGITISKKQLDFSRKRIFEAGLSDKVDIQYCDYRDMDGAFDRIASIEMFEAVGEAYWPAFFSKIHDLLSQGGKAGLQIITIAEEYFDDYRRNTDFIQRYVFPGGMLPSPSALAAQVKAAGLSVLDGVTFGQDYALTLNTWRDRFHDAWPSIERQGFDDRFRRLWNYYLSYCEAGFRAGTIDVTQLSVQRA